MYILGIPAYVPFGPFLQKPSVQLYKRFIKMSWQNKHLTQSNKDLWRTPGHTRSEFNCSQNDSQIRVRIKYTYLLYKKNDFRSFLLRSSAVDKAVLYVRTKRMDSKEDSSYSDIVLKKENVEILTGFQYESLKVKVLDGTLYIKRNWVWTIIKSSGSENEFISLKVKLVGACLIFIKRKWVWTVRKSSGSDNVFKKRRTRKNFQTRKSSSSASRCTILENNNGKKRFSCESICESICESFENTWSCPLTIGTIGGKYVSPCIIYMVYKKSFFST